MNTKSKIEKRLSSYWKMEILNIALVPAVMIYFASITDSPVGWLSLACMVPMCGLLAVGGLYWRGKFKQLKGDRSALNAALALAHLFQYPLLILTISSCALWALAGFIPGLSRGTGDFVVAAMAALLATLEYINYYHRQIQHFDHIEDFKRLLSGRGFRPAQMGQDLKAWRRKRRRSRSS